MKEGRGSSLVVGRMIVGQIYTNFLDYHLILEINYYDYISKTR